MAFWGREVKPKKSFTLQFSEFEGRRLHLSQATLGNKKSDERIIVKCSVADSPVVYLCSLLPGTVETCPLDLYFDDDVTFSVKGSTSVHLVGYFEGPFDENGSREDVEDDGYTDEEEEEDSEGSMDDFIVSGDEDASDDDWLSEEDDPVRVRKSGVIIEELTDEPPLNGSKKIVEKHGKSLVPVKGSVTKLKQKEVIGEGGRKQESESVEVAGVTDEKCASSSEDEDGFHVNRKRKLKEADNVQPSKKKSNGTPAEPSEPVTAPTGDHEADPDGSAKKKKKKKKKKGKSSSEDLSGSPSVQVNGTPQADSGKKGEVEKQDSKLAASSGKQDSNKKGSVRKHPNGLEIENIALGKPDGKQATPGKKVGMTYTGRLRSNGKIFDSNVGRKPFIFRLGVGEVIKGWDIGVNGMRVGDKRRLTIPPEMGYGSKGVPGIPPNSWLAFDVELVEVK